MSVDDVPLEITPRENNSVEHNSKKGLVSSPARRLELSRDEYMQPRLTMAETLALREKLNSLILQTHKILDVGHTANLSSPNEPRTNRVLLYFQVARIYQINNSNSYNRSLRSD